MSGTAITVESLSKRYQLGRVKNRQEGLRHAVEAVMRNPLAILRGSSPRVSAPTDDFWALRDLSFDVKHGEVVAIIGRNGAGKSTLLKLLSRITEPTSGRITIHGRVASLLEVGTGFHQELTGRENIFLNGAILGMTRSEIRGKFDEIVAFSEVERFLDTPVKRYSSGMYVRLAFAVAAHLEPEILIVDEVLAVGDAAFQKKCLGKMGQVAKGGRTVLFVSHNMAAVRTLCSTGVVLEKGRIITRGSVESCIAHYIGNSDSQLASTWENSRAHQGASPLTFQSVIATISGQQPDIELNIKCILQSNSNHKAAMLAFDILDTTGAVLMQALPRPSGFLEPSKGPLACSVRIRLPPLIPGRYAVTCWIGPHFSETFHLVNQAIAFDIDESPTTGRSYPHSIDHGAIVPSSEVYLLENT